MKLSAWFRCFAEPN